MRTLSVSILFGIILNVAPSNANLITEPFLFRKPEMYVLKDGKLAKVWMRDGEKTGYIDTGVLGFAKVIQRDEISFNPRTRDIRVFTALVPTESYASIRENRYFLVENVKTGAKTVCLANRIFSTPESGDKTYVDVSCRQLTSAGREVGKRLTGMIDLNNADFRFTPPTEVCEGRQELWRAVMDRNNPNPSKLDCLADGQIIDYFGGIRLTKAAGVAAEPSSEAGAN